MDRTCPVHPPPAAKALSDRITEVESSRLMAGSNEIHIRHDGQIYRLRVTKNGKPILTK